MRALVIVDYQTDFASPSGSLYVKGGEKLAEPIHNFIDQALSVDLLLVFTKDHHPADHCSFVDRGGVWPAHCVRGTEGATLFGDMDEIYDCDCDALSLKGFAQDDDSYSGFGGFVVNHDLVSLDEWLKVHAVDELFVCGLAKDFCVKATCLDGAKRGYKVTLLNDLTALVNPANEALVDAELISAGVTITTSDKVFA